MTTSACPLASIGSTVPWPHTPTFNGREIRASAEPGTTDRETRPRPGPGGAAEALTPCGGGAASRRPPGGVLLALRSGPVERARGTPGSGDGARRGGRRARTGRERHTRVSHTRACARVCTRAHTGPHPMSEGYFRVLRSHAQCVTATGDGDRVCVACVSGSASTPRGLLWPACSSGGVTFLGTCRLLGSAFGRTGGRSAGPWRCLLRRRSRLVPASCRDLPGGGANVCGTPSPLPWNRRLVLPARPPHPPRPQPQCLKMQRAQRVF